MLHALGLLLMRAMSSTLTFLWACVAAPWEVLIFMALCYLIYRAFLFLGYGQRRSIRFSNPYLGGKYYKELLNAGVSDPHQFYYQEAGPLQRPTYCNVCGCLMGGVSEDALSCDICGYATHERCVGQVKHNCKKIALADPASSLSAEIALSNHESSSSTSSSLAATSSSTPIPPSSSSSSSSSSPSSLSLHVDSLNNMHSYPHSHSPISPNPTMHHHWVQGNHSTLKDFCLVCSQTTGSLFSLSGLHCLWCHVNVHESCVTHIKENPAHRVCSLGPLARIILPPTAVQPAPGYTMATARLALMGELRSPKQTGEATSTTAASLKSLQTVLSQGSSAARHTMVTTSRLVENAFKRLSRSRARALPSNANEQTNSTSTAAAATAGGGGGMGQSRNGKMMGGDTDADDMTALSSSSSSSSSPSPPSSSSSLSSSSFGSSGRRDSRANSLTRRSTRGSTSSSSSPTSASTSLLSSAAATPLTETEVQAIIDGEAAASALPSSSSSSSSSSALPQVFEPMWHFNVPEHVSPLLVFINRKSGGNKGAQLMHEFLELLNPLQVWDLAQGGPDRLLRLFEHVPRTQVLVCGGDGTVSWVLSCVDKLRMPPPVAVLPLGTGNDLSQVLGWGGTCPDEPLARVLTRVSGARMIVLDRWNALVKPIAHEGEEKKVAQTAIQALPPIHHQSSLEKKDVNTSSEYHDDTSGQSFSSPTSPSNSSLSSSSSSTASSSSSSSSSSPASSSVGVGRRSASAARRGRVNTRATNGTSSSSFSSSSSSLSPSSPTMEAASLSTTSSPSPSSVPYPMSTTVPLADVATGPNHAIITNYMGIGIDATIAHNFANMRESYPHLFFSQFANKVWYAHIGTDAWLFHPSPRVLQESKVQVFVDGNELDLTGMQGVCFLNIKSFGGGINFWGNMPATPPFSEPRLDDQMLEVIGFKSSLHMGQIQLGLTNPTRLAQGSHVIIRTHGPLPFQVDGEPWGVKRACEVHVSLRTQSLMLSPSATETERNLIATFADVLHWAEQRQIVDSKQKAVVMKEFARRHGKIMPSSWFYRSAMTFSNTHPVT